jgi:GNAT superfamily N-acetyltransferase
MRKKLLALTLVIEMDDMLSGMNMYCHWHGELLDTWVAFEDDEPVGWSLRVRKNKRKSKAGGWSTSYGDNPEEGEVFTYVHPRHRRRGIGRALLLQVERDVGSAAPGVVYVWNDAARDFYSEVTPRGWEQREDR